MSSGGGASGSTLGLCSLARVALGPALGSGTLGADLVAPGVPATSATSLAGMLATLRPRTKRRLTHLNTCFGNFSISSSRHSRLASVQSRFPVRPRAPVVVRCLPRIPELDSQIPVYHRNPRTQSLDPESLGSRMSRAGVCASPCKSLDQFLTTDTLWAQTRVGHTSCCLIPEVPRHYPGGGGSRSVGPSLHALIRTRNTPEFSCYISHATSHTHSCPLLFSGLGHRPYQPPPSASPASSRLSHFTSAAVQTENRLPGPSLAPRSRGAKSINPG
ncbi:hypothetical protein PF002_g14859 [Phytophthora fragariae]|uniref:Uncharacterized protein n=3 Tax=Phytophthora fragariae TaxID=53985 RepID=A0A6A3SIN8_9STRA|nr:hypothetical protein PF003_g11316 [Phytophthora fragariae]KAE9117976.1 hypothetical protein PF006_g18700 [Phytophthora fragariae]KAE9201645.1 hypothetical protein PF004_g18656 [Phytophthora fragariae]KAE9223854.1 hypothetical protein PF002_g14859 [Phytophthora fragariae]